MLSTSLSQSKEQSKHRFLDGRKTQQFETQKEKTGLEKREEFAVHLRTSKKKQILAKKRLKIGNSSKSTVDTENPEQTISDFLVGSQPSKLFKIGELFGSEEKVKIFFQTYDMKQIQRFVSLICKQLFSTQEPKVQESCLTILINMTCYCVNISIYLASQISGIYSQLVRLFPIFPQDVCWLLEHLCTDGVVDLRSLVKHKVFSMFASMITQIGPKDVCKTAAIIIKNFPEQAEDIQDIADLQQDLSQLMNQVIIELEKHTDKLDSDDALMAFEFMTTVFENQLLDSSLLPSFEAYLFSDSNVRPQVANLMISAQQKVVDCCRLAVAWDQANSKQDEFLFCQLATNCLTTAQVVERQSIIQNICKAVNSGYAGLQKSALSCIKTHSINREGHLLIMEPKVQNALVKCLQNYQLFPAETVSASLDVFYSFFNDLQWELESEVQLSKHLKAMIYDPLDHLIMHKNKKIAQQSQNLLDMISDDY